MNEPEQGDVIEVRENDGDSSDQQFTIRSYYFKNKIFLFIKNLVSVNGFSLQADEVFQELLIKAWRRPELLSGARNEDAYLRTVVRNTIFDMMRSRRREVRTSTLDGTEMNADRDRPPSEPENEACEDVDYPPPNLGGDRSEKVREALLKLSPGDRFLILNWQTESDDLMKSICVKNKNTFNKRKSRAMERFKGHLIELGIKLDM